MINLKKIISNLYVFFLTVSTSFAVKVTENANKGSSGGGSSDTQAMIVGAIGLAILIGVIFGIIVFIVFKIMKKIREENRKYTDILFAKYKIEEKHARKNSDDRLRRKNWLLLGLTYKRSPVLVNSDSGLKKIGSYDGEMYKKEDFYLISVRTITGLFSRENYIIIIPYYLKHIVKKNQHGKAWELVLDVWGVDEVGNADYFLMPVVENPDNKKDGMFLDFADYIQKEYFNKYIFRDVIKSQSTLYAENVKEAIEQNPHINYERKNPQNE